MVSGKLSLSMGATCAAGAICNALKYANQEIPVASAESARNRSVGAEAVLSALNSPRAATSPQTSGRMQVVRIAVARFEDTPPTPIFARMAVAAASRGGYQR